MTVNFRILRSDKEKHDIIKINHNDEQDAITKLETYLKDIDKDYKETAKMLSLWALHDNAPCGKYKNVMQFESFKQIHVIIQVQRKK